MTRTARSRVRVIVHEEHAHVDVRKRGCVFAYHLSIYIYTYIHTYIHIYIYTYIHIYIYICIIAYVYYYLLVDVDNSL